nr:hypothetical protein [uncultured bacterium]
MSQAAAAPFAFLDVKALRRRFKAVCAATENRHQNFQIRVHRALSWFERAVELDEEEHPDGRLLYGWIALNALYGSWMNQPALPPATWSRAKGSSPG